MPVIGFLSATDGTLALASGHFHEGLARVGYVEGRNVTIEVTSASGQYERLPALAAELVRRHVTVIATAAPVSARAAKAATTTIPIVFALGSDPIKDRLVASLNRPGGNITGVTFFANLLSAKRLELLHRIVPTVTTIGVLANPENANVDFELHETEVAAHELGLQLVVANATSAGDIDAAFSTFSAQKAGAVFITGDAFFTARRSQIAALGIRYKLPTTLALREFAEAGGLMTYGANRTESYLQFGIYVGRVLKGEKPADLPVQQPTKFELVINIKTAKALGIEIPNSILLIADEQIE